MTTQHTALAGLPFALASADLNVVVASEWGLGQGHYLWTDPATYQKSYDNPPSGYMVHHTVATAVTPPPHDTSKANAWIGLMRDGKLYQTGGGTPTIYLASAGPARYSSGKGYPPAAWENTFRDIRSSAKAEGGDGPTALNRFVFNVEVVHAGDGSSLDAGVRSHVVGLGVELHRMFGWTERTLGHLSWTRRKIDPYWDADRLCIISIQDAIAEGHDAMNYFLRIFDLWTREDLDAMKAAGYWKGETSYYIDGSATDDEKINLTIHILANGNKDIPNR